MFQRFIATVAFMLLPLCGIILPAQDREEIPIETRPLKGAWKLTAYEFDGKKHDPSGASFDYLGVTPIFDTLIVGVNDKGKKLDPKDNLHNVKHLMNVEFPKKGEGTFVATIKTFAFKDFQPKDGKDTFSGRIKLVDKDHIRICVRYLQLSLLELGTAKKPPIPPEHFRTANGDGICIYHLERE